MALALAPVQLVDYAVREQGHARLLPGEGATAEMAHTVEIVASGQRHAHGIFLDIQVIANGASEESEEAGHAQRGHVRVAGNIQWAGEETPDDRDTLLVVNGMSLLYGVARAQLVQASSLSPGPRLMLPAFSFRDFDLTLDDAPSADEAAPDDVPEP